MTVRVDAASCSWLAYCDACGWRSRLHFTRPDAYADADAHRATVHKQDTPDARRRRQEARR